MYKSNPYQTGQLSRITDALTGRTVSESCRSLSYILEADAAISRRDAGCGDDSQKIGASADTGVNDRAVCLSIAPRDYPEENE